MCKKTPDSSCGMVCHTGCRPAGLVSGPVLPPAACPPLCCSRLSQPFTWWPRGHPQRGWGSYCSPGTSLRHSLYWHPVGFFHTENPIILILSECTCLPGLPVCSWMESLASTQCLSLNKMSVEDFNDHLRISSVFAQKCNSQVAGHACNACIVCGLVCVAL